MLWLATKTELTDTIYLINKCVFETKANIYGDNINKRDAIGILEIDIIKQHIEQNTEFIVINVPINH